MKIIRTLAIGVLAASAVAASGAYAAETPSGWDADFYACAEDSFGTEFPDEAIPATGLSDDQLAKMTQIRCRYDDGPAKISSVAGLEKMTALKEISLRNTLIKKIDFSSNLALENIDLGNNSKLETVNVSENKKLNTFWLSNDEKISSIDISNNTKLGSLYIDGTSIQSIDISNCLGVGTTDLGALPRFLANDGTIIKTGIIGKEYQDSIVFDFSKLSILDSYETEDYIAIDGPHTNMRHIATIKNTDYYSYDSQSKKLTVSNLEMTNNYATLNVTYISDYSGTALDVEPTSETVNFTYKLLLETDQKQDDEQDKASTAKTPDTGLNTDNQNYLAAAIIILPALLGTAMGIRHFIRSRKSIKFDY